MALRSLICALITILTLVSCDGPKPAAASPAPEVLQKMEREKKGASGTFFIKKIHPDGTVAVGRKGEMASLSKFPAGELGKYLPLVLVGKAQVGDPVEITFVIEDQALENGAVKSILTKVKVVSLNNNLLQEHFKEKSD